MVCSASQNITFLDASTPATNNGGMKAKPDWFKIRLPNAKGHERFSGIKKTLRELSLVTVCEEAHCPNILECWSGGTATFMVMGDTCTRGCRFCAVRKGNPNGKLDPDEPRHLAEAIARLKLDYAVITSVDRDDLSDGGAAHFAECITCAKKINPNLLVDVLTPDFAGDLTAVQKIVDAKPHVFAHNVETVHRLQRKVRDGRANYEQSLSVLRYVKEKDPDIITKSAIMLGFGETEEEVIQVMKDLLAIGVGIFTIGQYLRPSRLHVAITEFVPPAQFAKYQKIGEELGFLYVASGPFIRSSYKAGELFVKNILRGKTVAQLRTC